MRRAVSSFALDLLHELADPAGPINFSPASKSVLIRASACVGVTAWHDIDIPDLARQ